MRIIALMHKSGFPVVFARRSKTGFLPGAPITTPTSDGPAEEELSSREHGRFFRPLNGLLGGFGAGYLFHPAVRP